MSSMDSPNRRKRQSPIAPDAIRLKIGFDTMPLLAITLDSTQPISTEVPMTAKGTDVCACKRLELLRVIVKELVDPDANLGYGNFCRFRLHILGRLFCLFGRFLFLLNGRSIAGAFL